MVLVTHHVEEIPEAFTDLLALAGGRIVGSGPLPATLDGDLLTRTFGLPIEVDRVRGRFTARRS